ncbi:hypothetical protein OIV83_002580 [Microbotryomycetes sp. JL201]|nr:hypothetical protein OIV83_002580 [Microbotryomycetes sp. JL201]
MAAVSAAPVAVDVTPAPALEPVAGPDVDMASKDVAVAPAINAAPSNTVQETIPGAENPASPSEAAQTPAPSTKPAKIRSPFAELKNFLRSPKASTMQVVWHSLYMFLTARPSGSPTTETPPQLESAAKQDQNTAEPTPVTAKSPSTEVPTEDNSEEQQTAANEAQPVQEAPKDVKRPKSPPFLEKLKHVFSSDKKERKEKNSKSDKEASSDEEGLATFTQPVTLSAADEPVDKVEPVTAEVKDAPPTAPLDATGEAVDAPGSTETEPVPADAVKFESAAATKDDKPKKEKDAVKLGRRLSAKVTGLFSSSSAKKDKATASANEVPSTAETATSEAPKIETAIDESKVVPEVKADEPAAEAPLSNTVTVADRKVEQPGSGASEADNATGDSSVADVAPVPAVVADKA